MSLLKPPTSPPLTMLNQPPEVSLTRSTIETSWSFLMFHSCRTSPLSLHHSFYRSAKQRQPPAQPQTSRAATVSTTPLVQTCATWVSRSSSTRSVSSRTKALPQTPLSFEVWWTQPKRFTKVHSLVVDSKRTCACYRRTTGKVLFFFSTNHYRRLLGIIMRHHVGH